MADKILEIANLNYTYSSRLMPTIKNISLDINSGDFVLISGHTGCGKSTLLKTFNGIIPHEAGGKMTGKVIVNGVDTLETPIYKLSSEVGLVFQNPEDQIFSSVVEDEVAFVLENSGLERDVISQRVKWAIEKVGLAGLEKASVAALSGGQKQRLAVASVLAAKPKIIALDEPISQLDPKGAEELLALLADLNQQGITVIIVEHRIQEVVSYVNRIILMDCGQIVWDGSTAETVTNPSVFRNIGLRIPEPVEISHSLGIKPIALTTQDIVQRVRSTINSKELHNSTQVMEKRHFLQNEKAVEIKKLSFRYLPNSKNVLQNVDLTVYEGECIALMGKNGAGKSTLLQHIMGLLKSDSGAVKVLGQDVSNWAQDEITKQVGMIFQNPDLMLFCPTVEQEILFGLEDKDKLRAVNMMEEFGLAELARDFPLALSKGQRLRVALAAVFALKPKIVLMDEPTTGQNMAHIEDMMDYAQNYARQGNTVIFCTHDVEIAARYADRIVVMSGGQILAQGRKEDVFSEQEVLAKACLKAPPSFVIGCALGYNRAFTPKEVVEYARKEYMGTNAV